MIFLFNCTHTPLKTISTWAAQNGAVELEKITPKHEIRIQNGGCAPTGDQTARCVGGDKFSRLRFVNAQPLRVSHFSRRFLLDVHPTQTQWRTTAGCVCQGWWGGGKQFGGLQGVRGPDGGLFVGEVCAESVSGERCESCPCHFSLGSGDGYRKGEKVRGKQERR